MDNINEFITLIQENPDLPIVPMVDGDVVSDNSYAYWAGSFGASLIDEYIITEDGVFFKSDDDVFDTLERILPYEEYANLPFSEEECRSYYDKLTWTKAIIVYIGLPKQEGELCT